MRHDADELRLARRGLGRKALLQSFGKKAEVIRADVLVAEVVHGEISEHRERAAVARLDRDEREIGILRSSLARGVVPIPARVHVRSHRHVSKRILRDAIRPADPLTKRSEIPGVALGKSDARRLQCGVGGGDGFHEFVPQEGHVRRVRVGAETTHRGRRAVRMRGGDEHPIFRNARAFFRERLGFIEQRPGHHATVHDDDDELLFVVRERDGACMDARFDGAHGPTDHPTIDQHRQCRRRDVHGGGSRLEVRAKREHARHEKGECEPV